MLADADDRIWRALGDATRRNLLDLCTERPRTTGELCDAFPQLGRTGVMKHLDVLEEAGLLVIRREGRMRFNVTDGAPLRRVCLPWVSRHASRVANVLQGLKQYVESQAADASSKPKRGARNDRKQRTAVRRKRRDR